jgi:hypothetical protein
MDVATTKYQLQVRKQIVINTDPQRRCYDGCNFSEETVWTAWGEVCTYRLRETAEDSAQCFKQINPSREYRVVEVQVG